MGALIGLKDKDAKLIVKALRSYEDPSDTYDLTEVENMLQLADYIENTIGSVIKRKKSDE